MRIKWSMSECLSQRPKISIFPTRDNRLLASYSKASVPSKRHPHNLTKLPMLPQIPIQYEIGHTFAPRIREIGSDGRVLGCLPKRHVRRGTAPLAVVGRITKVKGHHTRTRASPYSNLLGNNVGQRTRKLCASDAGRWFWSTIACENDQEVEKVSQMGREARGVWNQAPGSLRSAHKPVYVSELHVSS